MNLNIFKKKNNALKRPVKDLLGGKRNADTFTNRQETVLPWEEGLDGGAYSTYFSGKNKKIGSDKRIISEALNVLRNFIMVMRIKVPPVNIKVHESDSYTDGKTICVGTQVVKSKHSEQEKVDTIIGFGVHEAGHILYTDFPAFEAYAKRQGKFGQDIYNVIEDERMELLIGENFPGYARFLEPTKKYAFEEMYLEELDKMSKKQKDDKLNKFWGLFLSTVRYPATMPDKLEKEEEEFVDAVWDILTEYPKDKVEVEIAADKIIALFEDKVDKDCKKKVNDGHSEAMKEYEKIFVMKIAEAVAQLYEGCTDKIKGELLKEFGSFLLPEGEEFGTDTTVKFFKRKNMPYEYANWATSVKKYASALSRILFVNHRDYKLSIPNVRSGYLDTDKLAEAVQGVSTVYERHGYVKTQKISVVLLIDESGSMSGGWGSYNGGDAPYIQAAKTAILFNEALRKQPEITFFVYGHNTDGMETHLFVYKEPGHNQPTALGNVHPAGANRDGVAIYEAAVRVRKFTNDPALFFIISDGEPSAEGYNQPRSFDHTKEMALKIEKMGFFPIHIAIDPSVKSEKMFKHFVKITDISDLPFLLSRLLKKAISKIQKNVETVI